MVIGTVVVGFVALVVALNVISHVPAWRAGYRPGTSVPTLDDAPPLTATPDEQIAGRLVIGWKVRNPPRFTLKLDPSGGLLLGGPTRVWIDRGAVSTVRVFRWWGQTCLVLDSPDHRYGAIVLRPDDPDSAIARLTALGWPVP